MNKKTAIWRMKFKLSPDARYIPKRSQQIKNRRRKRK